MRIFADDLLKLLMCSGRALFGRSKAGVIGLGRHARRANRSVEGAHSLAEPYACFLILLTDVVPTADQRGHYGEQKDGLDDQLGLVFNRPMDSLYVHIHSRAAESVLCQ